MFAMLLFASSLLIVSGSATLAQDSGTAMVRVVHASPDAPPVDVWVDGNRAIQGLAFGNATDFVSLPAGTHQVAVTPANQPIGSAVIDTPLTLQAGMAYEVAAVGKLANIAAQVYPVDLSPLAAGKARVRVVHASPDTPAVDVAVTGGPVLFSNVSFPNGTDYATVDAGTYNLDVRPAGTSTVALALRNVSLKASTVYDVFAIGLSGDKSLKPLILTGTAGATSQMPVTGSGTSILMQSHARSGIAAFAAALSALAFATLGLYLRRRNA